MPVVTFSRSTVARRVAPALLALAAGAAGAAPPDPALRAAASAAEPAVIASLKEMVLIESGSSDAAGLSNMAGYVEGRLQALGASALMRRSVAQSSDLIAAVTAGSICACISAVPLSRSEA